MSNEQSNNINSLIFLTVTAVFCISSTVVISSINHNDSEDTTGTVRSSPLSNHQHRRLQETFVSNDAKGQEWPSALFNQQITPKCHIPLQTMCDFEWEMNTGPETNYDEDYFAWQKKDGMATGKKNADGWKWRFDLNNKVVADIGCGGGYAVTEITEANKRFCFEINPAAIKEHPDNVISVHRWSQIPENYVDNMFSHHSFEHHPHPLLSLQCAMRKLKPKTGIMYVNVPFEYGGCGLGDGDYGRFYDEPNPSFHIYTWNPRNLGQLMHAAGFVDIECLDLRGVDPKKFIEKSFYTQAIWCHGRRP